MQGFIIPRTAKDDPVPGAWEEVSFWTLEVGVPSREALCIEAFELCRHLDRVSCERVGLLVVNLIEPCILLLYIQMSYESLMALERAAEAIAYLTLTLDD